VNVPVLVRWSATLVGAFVVCTVAYFLRDSYESTRTKAAEHELRIQAEERTSAVTALQLTLMQRQLDRIEAKLDTVVERRR